MGASVGDGQAQIVALSFCIQRERQRERERESAILSIDRDLRGQDMVVRDVQLYIRSADLSLHRGREARLLGGDQGPLGEHDAFGTYRDGAWVTSGSYWGSCFMMVTANKGSRSW